MVGPDRDAPGEPPPPKADAPSPAKTPAKTPKKASPRSAKAWLQTMAAKTESYGAPGAVAADGSKIDAFGRRVAEGGAAEPPAKRRRVVLPIEAKPDDARHPGDAKLVEQLLPRLRDFLGVGDADDGPFDRSLLEDALRKVLGVYGVDRLMSLPEGRRVEEEMSLLERAMNFVLDHQTRSAGPSNAGGSSAFGSASRAALEAKPAPEPASLSTVDLCGDGANSELEASSMASPERGSGGYISLSDDDEPDEPATSFIDIGGVKVTVSGPPRRVVLPPSSQNGQAAPAPAPAPRPASIPIPIVGAGAGIDPVPLVFESAPPEECFERLKERVWKERAEREASGTVLKPRPISVDLDADEDEDSEQAAGTPPVAAETEDLDIWRDLKLVDLQPPGLKVQLLAHQVCGVRWMLRQELLTTRGGGILADDMGLGKTIQALALILANPPAPSSKAKTTLVVCPLGVLNQWYTEIREKTFKGTLRVGVHHPTVGQKLSPGQMTSLYDVVLTTFDMVTRESPHPRKSAKPAAGAGPAKKATRKEQPANESGPLFRVEFHRIVLDESHWVKNPAAERTRAVLELQGRHRWCLSGTPLQNSVSDLYPPFRFLGVPDFPTKEAFDRSIASLLPTRRSAEAMTRLHGVLRDYCLRRRKTDLSPLGKPLLDLPGRTVVLDSEAKFSEDERRFYNAIARNTRRMFARLMKRGTVMRNWSNVLVRILRERQAADDYRIIRAHFTKKDLGDEGLSYDELLAKIFGDVTEQDRTRELERARKLFPKAVFEGLVRAGKEAERSEAGGKNRFADTCPICRDQCEAATVVRCGHVFCRDCITNYANDESNKDSGCPVCSFTPIKANELVSAEAFYVAPAVPADADSTQAALDEEERKQDQQDEAAIRKVLQEGPQCGAKILRLLQLLRAQQESKPGSKAIVFSSFTSMLDLCGKALKDAGIGFARYDGEMTPEQRNSAIRSLNSDPRTLVLLVSLKAGGVGLNLTAASRAYLVDVWYNPAAEEQAIDRIHRIGQREDVLVTRITITGTIEDTIYRLQERKSRLARGTLGDDRGTGGESNRLTLRDLIELFGGSVAL